MKDRIYLDEVYTFDIVNDGQEDISYTLSLEDIENTIGKSNITYTYTRGGSTYTGTIDDNIDVRNLSVGESVTVTLKLISSTSGTYKGRLKIETNDPLEAFDVTINTTNVTSNSATVSVNYDGTNTVTITPDSGYYLSEASCTNGYTTNATTGTSATGEQTVIISNNGNVGESSCTFTGYREWTCSKTSSNGNWIGVYSCNSNSSTCSMSQCKYKDGTVCNGGGHGLHPTAPCRYYSGDGTTPYNWCNTSLSNSGSVLWGAMSSSIDSSQCQ